MHPDGYCLATKFSASGTGWPDEQVPSGYWANGIYWSNWLNDPLDDTSGVVDEYYFKSVPVKQAWPKGDLHAT